MLGDLKDLTAIAPYFAFVLSIPAAPYERESFQVHGHRGARAALPENTLEAFKYAESLGVDYIELDVRYSQDDEIVVHHDPEINEKLCSQGLSELPRDLTIRKLNLTQLKKFDCGAKTNPIFPKQRSAPGAQIPSLREVLEAFKDSSVGLHIEIKTDGPNVPDAKTFAKHLMSLVHDYGYLDRAIVQSFDVRYTQAAAKVAEWLGRKKDPRVISPKYTWLQGPQGKPLMKLLHGKGLKVVPWTVNSPKTWESLIELGVDGIVTDDPEALLVFLKQRGLR